MELTREQMQAVQNQAQTIGLVIAYYNKFGEDALKVAKGYFSEAGRMLGESLKSSLNIVENDANAVATALNAFLMQAAGMPAGCKVEGDKVICDNEAFCPVMEAVKMVNAPWDKIDLNYAWPFFEGVASAINPGIKMEVLESRYKGDERCRHVITVPK